MNKRRSILVTLNLGECGMSRWGCTGLCKYWAQERWAGDENASLGDIAGRNCSQRDFKGVGMIIEPRTRQMVS